MTMRKLTDEEMEKRRMLNERFKNRQPPPGWERELGIPYYPEDYSPPGEQEQK